METTHIQTWLSEIRPCIRLWWWWYSSRSRRLSGLLLTRWFLLHHLRCAPTYDPVKNDSCQPCDVQL